MKETIDSLNPEQREAVVQTSGPVLVLAGAGTGKTRVITVRIAYLISKGALPESILAMTFTNKAAGEMRERLAKLVGKKKASFVIASTFHSYCLRTLRDYTDELGYPEGFTIADASDHPRGPRPDPRYPVEDIARQEPPGRPAQLPRTRR